MRAVDTGCLRAGGWTDELALQLALHVHLHVTVTWARRAEHALAVAAVEHRLVVTLILPTPDTTVTTRHLKIDDIMIDLQILHSVNYQMGCYRVRFD